MSEVQDLAERLAQIDMDYLDAIDRLREVIKQEGNAKFRAGCQLLMANRFQKTIPLEREIHDLLERGII